MTRVGFVGLGRMGTPMCRHILCSGFPLAVYDLRPEAVEALVTLGASYARSPRELAAKSDVMIVMVTDDEQVHKVVSEMIQVAQVDTVIAICASVHPETCRGLARMAAERGVGVVDSPVARGQRGAEAGDLTVFAGGEARFVDACRPVFAAFAKQVLHMGEVGAGQMTKTCNNLMHWAQVAACHEVLSFGARLGIRPSTLRQALVAGSADSRTLRELHLVGMYWPHKDLDTAMQLAKETQTVLPLTDRVREAVTKISAQDLRALFDEA